MTAIAMEIKRDHGQNKTDTGENTMPTARSLFIDMAEILMEKNIKTSIDFLKSDNTPGIKKMISGLGMDKTERALCDAYIYVLTKKREKLTEEIRKNQKRHF